MAFNLITILGPTAVGKTRLAALLANRFNGEIISADSRQVYRGMDIGTGKDLTDYIVDGETVRYHLIDVLEPHNEFSLYSFKKYFYDAFEKIIVKNKIPFLVGGTGLYIHSILKNYSLANADLKGERFEELNLMEVDALRGILVQLNPALHNSTDLLLKDRIIKAIIVAEQSNIPNVAETAKIKSFNIGVKLDRSVVREKITARLKQRLNSGMIDEVIRLRDSGVSFEKLEFFGLEYKFIAKYLKCEISYEKMFELLNTAIHQFAKRQMTWFRKMEKEGITIHWIDGPDFNAAESLIAENFFNE